MSFVAISKSFDVNLSTFFFFFYFGFHLISCYRFSPSFLTFRFNFSVAVNCYDAIQLAVCASSQLANCMTEKFSFLFGWLFSLRCRLTYALLATGCYGPVSMPTTMLTSVSMTTDHMSVNGTVLNNAVQVLPPLPHLNSVFKRGTSVD